MLNPDVQVKEITDPYPIWIIDNLLDGDVMEKMKTEWLDNDSERWNTTRKMVSGKENILERKMLNISKKEEMPEYIASVCEFLHGEEFTKKIEEMTGVTELIPDKTMRWSGMRVMTEGSYQLIHSDAREHPENGLRKELTCLLYLNDDYEKSRDEGCLEIWNDDMTERVHELEPIDNRLVIFLNSDTSYHGVPLVKKDRKAITFSILKNEKSSGRKFAKFVGRPEDSDEVSLMGSERGMGK